MAGQGPAPKDAAQRRRRNAPARGEWVDLPSVKKPILPTLKQIDGKRKWSPQLKMLWEHWRKDPATTQYGPAEIALAKHLAFVYDDLAQAYKLSTSSEVRLILDTLGLTPKGKRDNRWRISADGGVDQEGELDKTAANKRAAARRKKIRAVEPAKA